MVFFLLQELKGKFLIKGKRLNKLEAIFAQEAAAADTDVTEEEESGDEEEDEQKEKVRAVIGDDSSPLVFVLFAVSSDFPVAPQKKKKLKLAKELSDMVIYCKSVHFHGFEDARENLSFYEMSSFKEGKAVKLSEESGETPKPSCWVLQPRAHHQITISSTIVFFPPFFFFVFRSQRIHSPQRREAEPHLSCRRPDRLVQLRPRPSVERRLPDG